MIFNKEEMPKWVKFTRNSKRQKPNQRSIFFFFFSSLLNQKDKALLLNDNFFFTREDSENWRWLLLLEFKAFTKLKSKEQSTKALLIYMIFPQNKTTKLIWMSLMFCLNPRLLLKSNYQEFHLLKMYLILVIL